MVRKSFWLPLVSLALFLLLWQGLASFQGSQGSNIPSPSEVFQAFSTVYRTEFWQDLEASLLRLVPGLFLGVCVGLGAGLVAGRNSWLRLTAGPLLHGWRALPAVALAPLFVQLLGINEHAKIIVIAVGVFFPVWVATQDGASNLNPELLELAETLKLPRHTVYRKILLPWTIPFAVSGIRIGIGSGYTMLFFSEWLGASAGIGYRASVANTTGRLDLMVLSLVELGLMAYLTDLLFSHSVRALAPWIKHAR